jgi:hydroxymethylglutaryl-CoA lyase
VSFQREQGVFDFQGDVLIEDEFLRDGLQNDNRVFSVEERLDFLASI